MSTQETHAPPSDSEIESDEEAVMASFLNGKPLDPQVALRVHQRGQRIRENVFRKHGIVDVAVPAIREFRGELPE